MKPQIKTIMPSLALAAILFAGVAASPLAANAGNPNPGILPINSSPAGQSYGNWAAAWWQWVLSVPAAQNPGEDTTGANAGQNQSGQVWFLGGAFGDLPNATRTFTMPAGKMIFVPVYVWIFGASVGDCQPSNPGVTCDIPTLQQSAAAAATSVKEIDVTIDGVTVDNLRSYRAASPGGFNVTLPDANILQAFGLPDPAGIYSPQVADGFWLMLAPLSAGSHTIVVHAIPDPNFGIEQTMTYHVSVGK